MSETIAAENETNVMSAETLAPPRAIVIHDQEFFRRLGVLGQVNAMLDRGWHVDVDYCLSSWEFVFTVTVPSTTDKDKPPIVIMHRDGKPDRPWRRVVHELQDRRLWPLG